jgi:uncharacterized glyoxalase superfamily protein PhnB
MQRIKPYIDYADVGAAIDWLSGAFGFTEVLRVVEDDGWVNHAEISLGTDATVLLGSPRGLVDPVEEGFPYACPVCEVDDVDAHFARAKAAGAQIVKPATDEPFGGRMYRCVDPFGHSWFFLTPTDEVKPEEWGAVGAAAS